MKISPAARDRGPPPAIMPIKCEAVLQSGDYKGCECARRAVYFCSGLVVCGTHARANTRSWLTSFDRDEYRRDAFIRSTERNSSNLFEWAIQEGCPLPATWLYEVLNRDRLAILKLALREHAAGQRLVVADAALFMAAVAAPARRIVNWLADNRCPAGNAIHGLIELGWKDVIGKVLRYSELPADSLATAARYNRKEMFKWLIERGARITVRAYEEAGQNAPELIDICMTDEEVFTRAISGGLGRVLVAAAAERENLAALILLRNFGIEWPAALARGLVSKRQVRMIQWLLENGYLWPAHLLAAAVSEGDIPLFVWLIEQGCRCNEEVRALIMSRADAQDFLAYF